MLLPAFLALQFLALHVAADCNTPGPAFHNPGLTGDSPNIKPLTDELTKAVKAAVEDSMLLNSTHSSFAVELTSATDTLWTSYYTAPEEMLDHPIEVNGDTVFRIASITKVFTTLTVLMQKNINLDDPITKYIPELHPHAPGTIEWCKVTLHDLISQASGAGRNWPAGDLSNSPIAPNPSKPESFLSGFPLLPQADIPKCDGYFGGELCTRQQLLSAIKTQTPIFTPGARASYSNTAYALLAIALEKITGKTYKELLQSTILDPLGMDHTFTEHPANGTGAVPSYKHTNWYDDLGNDFPGGGIYSSVSDISKFARAILNVRNIPKKQRLLAPEKVDRWFKPTSFLPDLHNLQGAPWEIHRLASEELVPDGRPIDLITKNGDLSGYYTMLVFIPEYNVAVTILTAGERAAVQNLEEVVVPRVVKGMEKIFREHNKKVFAGKYAADELDTAMTFEVNDGPGLEITGFKSNGTDMMPLIDMQFNGMMGGLTLRASPAGVKKADGESWRIKMGSTNRKKEGYLKGAWCYGDASGQLYGGQSVMEVVFRNDSLYLPAFRVELFKQE